MAAQILGSPPPTDTTNLQLHMEKSPLKGTWKLNRQSIHNKGQHHKEQERKKYSPTMKIKHPSHSVSWSGGISKVQNLSLRSEGFKFYIRYLNSQILHRKGEPSKHLSLKAKGEYIQNNYGTAGKEKSAYKGLMHRFNPQRNQYKSTRQKSIQSISKRDTILILKHLLERKEAAGNLPQN